MATFIDLGLLQYVKIVFPFVLVWAVVYSILEWRKVLGENQNIHSVVALVVAMLTVLSAPVVEMIEVMIPWFGMLIIVVVFLVLFLKFFNVSDDAIGKAFTTGSDARSLVYWVILITILIMVCAFGKVFFAGTSLYVGEGDAVSPAESILEVSTGTSVDGVSVASASGEENFVATLFHPKVLGMLFVLLLAGFTIKLLAGDVVKK